MNRRDAIRGAAAIALGATLPALAEAPEPDIRDVKKWPRILRANVHNAHDVYGVNWGRIMSNAQAQDNMNRLANLRLENIRAVAMANDRNLFRELTRGS
jgi:hypothetical protein